MESGGLGFKGRVYIQIEPSEIGETRGQTPKLYKDDGAEKKAYYGNAVMLFTKHGAALKLNEPAALKTIVHEFTHAFGFPHKCGYYSWQSPMKYSCAMNYAFQWLYAPGTRLPQMYVTGERDGALCGRHLDGMRKVHLEDNPVMWKWKK